MGRGLLCTPGDFVADMTSMSLKQSKTCIQRKLENSGRSQWIKQEGGQSFDARGAKNGWNDGLILLVRSFVQTKSL